MKYIDLSHTITDGLVTYKGLPAPVICDYLSRENSKEFYEPGTEFQIGRIDMVANTGTYLDCPFHRYADGHDLSQLVLEQLVNIPSLVVQAPFAATLPIGLEYFEHLPVKGRAVLVYTGWSQFWNSDRYFENHPFLTEAAALYLRDNGAVLVGIDSHNIDDTRTRARPVHSTLLKAGILIVEHLTNLDKLPTACAFLFSAVPPKIKGMGTFPVRAFVQVPE